MQHTHFILAAATIPGIEPTAAAMIGTSAGKNPPLFLPILDRLY